MDLVNDRKISDTPIFRAFVERVLKKRAKDISRLCIGLLEEKTF